MRGFLILLLAAAALPAQDLMPLPAKFTRGQGAMAIGEGFRVTYSGHREPRVEAAGARLIERLIRKTGIPIRGTGQESLALEIRCSGAGDADESYRLSITPRGGLIEAVQPPGALHGMATFAQLVQLGPEGYHAPALEIQDSPALPLARPAARRGPPLDAA